MNGEKYEGNFIVEKLKLNSNKFSIHPLTIRFITRGKGHSLDFASTEETRWQKKASRLMIYWSIIIQG